MNKIEIEIPNGKEIDWEASAKQERIVFRDKQLTYEDMCQKLFKGTYCFIGAGGYIWANGKNENCRIDPNNAPTTHQLECILAKNKLANVAVYLNNGWKPDLYTDNGFCIVLDGYNNLVIDGCGVLCPYSLGKVIFKSRELAKQALEILGEETVKLALEPLY
jgi:hypothetical protein